MFAQDQGLIVHHPPPKSLTGWEPPLADASSNGPFNLAIVSSFGYRGPSPIQYSIINGDSRTGVTIQILDPKVIDSGHILAQSQLASAPAISVT
ncbi:Methionyl-tRNA formyltransferase [Spiromyces aspiralis]|uniref:Methionyl-tRNA formyltransferase n=1 Tax=Spiromyces aspiralis TaxID=68401 RepID=A0ACC1HJF0_9FUNG|nr:Methionyl-tRNA formyltransferase [Spiromyces aspiralis]